MTTDAKLTRDDLLHLTDHFALQGSGHAIHRELIEAKLHFLDRVLEAGSDGEIGNAHAEYQSDVFTIVHGQFTVPRGDRKALAYDAGPLRSGDDTPVRPLLLGEGYDDALVQARTDYLTQCVRAKYREHAFKAFADYKKKVLRIVDEAIEVAARQMRDRKEYVVDRTRTPAPEPAPAHVVPETELSMPRVEVVSTTDTEQVSDATLAVELERALAGRPPDTSAERINAVGGHAEFEAGEAKKRSPYDEYNERVSNAFKTQPPPIRKRKRTQHDPVA